MQSLISGMTHNGEMVDPKIVDEILSKELLQLSLKERTIRQEEIHGVTNAAQEETPEFVASCLHRLHVELENVVPDGEKQAYLRARSFPHSYVNTDSFRMRFLRSRYFDVPHTARCIVTFLGLTLELFGEKALQRPVRMTDFSNDELRALKLGRFQFLPFGDRVGRRILGIFPDETWESIPVKTKAKISLYTSWTAGDDIETQKKGLVLIIWFSEGAKLSKAPANINDRALHTCRVSAMHLCTPDTPFFRFRRAIVTMRVGHIARRGLRVHLGSHVEINYKLQSYGIPIDQIPISITGKIKKQYMLQWVRVRCIIEQSLHDLPPMNGNVLPNHYSSNGLHNGLYDHCNVNVNVNVNCHSHSHSHSHNGRLSEPPEPPVLEYPGFHDVVFRTGCSNVSHPANAHFRNLVEAKVMADEFSRIESGVKVKRRNMIRDIIAETEGKGGRFLLWNDVGGWSQILDESNIVSRIESLIKEFRRPLKRARKTNQYVLSSLTSSNDGGGGGRSGGRPDASVLELDGGTSAFLLEVPEDTGSCVLYCNTEKYS
eukprot:CAMPEP_0172385344 /NCGR_PEP_ID=MMETSP1061-20121228/3016_1 /TAXON_ID=37318 /ORGANISM="Pseudo-nitzschia pungens, Strain cf. pungens" /LENGTH=543 /DNA_ID=CAMNT_0013114321 /DNA_START=612 /DNA_END=2243 /DNA_ORIENTATION=-